MDVLTAQAGGAAELEDPELLDRATALDRALFKFFQEKSSHRIGQSLGLQAPLKEFHILIGNCELPVTVQMTILISKMVNDEDKFSFTDTGGVKVEDAHVTHQRP